MAGDEGARDLVRSEAAYLIGPAEKRHFPSLRRLVDTIVATISPVFGGFLLVEVWVGPTGGPGIDPRQPEAPPRFRIVAPPESALSPVVDKLATELSSVKILRRRVAVEIDRTTKVAPPGVSPLVARSHDAERNCWVIGIEVPPVWRDEKTGVFFPLLYRTFRRRLSHVIRQGVFEFVSRHTKHQPPHYHALGRRAMVKAVWKVDAQLAAVSNAFDFLLQVTPINSDAAWRQFRSSAFEREPDFHYLPTPMDPPLLKRQLYRVPVERIEDPALQHLFREKQEELDRKITLLRDRNTFRFRYGSLQLYGPISDGLYRLAQEILEIVPSRTKDEARGGSVKAKQFAAIAEEEFAHYRKQYDGFAATVEVTARVAGIMVSRGKLLVNKNLVTPRSRVEPLLHHEVGTHLVTYYNGRAQPFRLLASGLAAYEELQEGLAVLAEYLAGGLSRPRLRQLAARVVAARMLVDGADFVQTFRTLDRNYDFAQKAAYTITMRIFRGGGLTKDMVYLRGLRAILRYLRRGGDLAPLLVGKIAAEHVPIIKELSFRQVLVPPPLRPRYLDHPQAQLRLAQLRQGLTVAQLVEQRGAHPSAG